MSLILYNFFITNRAIYYLLIIFISMFLLGCSKNIDVTGGGSEAENAIVVGVVENSEGNPASNVKVQMVPSNYNPLSDSAIPDSFTVTTNDDGQYRFVVQDSGLYNIQAYNSGDGSRAVHSQVAVNKGEEISIPTVMLQPPISIQIPLDGLGNETGGHLYVPGLNYVVDVPENYSDSSFIVIDSIPSNFNVSLLFVDTVFKKEITLINETEINDVSGLIHLHPYGIWDIKKEILINTGPSGANINNNQIGFPVVIRLDKDNFDFEYSNSDGSDLRFAKMDSSKISFEIELWDYVSKEAIVWIHLDTIFGNSQNQKINMFYGNERAQARDVDYNVFSQENGFSGVWHLSEEAKDTNTTDLYKNSVRDEDHGDDKITSDDKSGYIGKGSYLKGNDFIRISNPSKLLTVDSQVSLSAWVMVDSNNILRNTFITMGVSYGLRLEKENLHSFVFYNNSFQSYSATGPPLRDNSWHLVSSVYSGTQLKLYIDGDLIGSTPKSGLLEYPNKLDDTTFVRPHLLIGKAGAAGPEVNFEGFIDEVRVSRVSRSNDWIKLMYENQKRGSNLITIK